MLYREEGASAVARSDDEGSSPGEGLPAPPCLCAALCLRGSNASSTLPPAGEAHILYVLMRGDRLLSYTTHELV